MKRQEAGEWTVQGGVVTGHYHLERFANGQDAIDVAVHESGTGKRIAAVVCDGCGSCTNSEVGASLISTYLTKQIMELFKRDCAPSLMPSLLFSALLDYIQMQLHLHCEQFDLAEKAKMINRFWLCSIIALAMNDTQGYLFWSGDPTYALDDELVTIDEDNSPSYVAYRCLGNPGLFGVTERHIPKSFQCVEFDPTITSRIMISSDGFTTLHAKKFNAACKNESLSESLHGFQWGIRGKIGLKLWMNTRQSRGYFNDDCGIVVVEKTNV